ncbi:MAG: hypothetical protein J6S58_01950 [Lentisphaeria bacterium]|nr:hypothetical protein [Lentisphaeria bacterium]
MRKKHSHERGQAVCELVAGLLGLCIIMIGLLALALLGMHAIRNTIQARTLADEYSRNGRQHSTARFILDWGSSRSVVLSGKGKARYSSLHDPGAFTEELSDNTFKFHTHYLGTKAPYAENSFDLVESNLMVEAARLTFGSSVQGDVLQQYRHFDAVSILKSLGLPCDFTLKEDICMPLNSQ